MAERGRKIQGCVNASNPYHECTDSCLKKISQGITQKDKKKSDDGIGQIRLHQDCPKASNPFHECNENCLKRVAGAAVPRDKKESGSFILDVSNSFGRKKKERSQPKPPQVHDNEPLRSTVFPSDAESPPSHFVSKKKMDVENGEPHFEKSRAQDPIVSNGKVQSPQSVRTPRAEDPSVHEEQIQSSHWPAFDFLIGADRPKDRPKEIINPLAKETPTNQEEDEKLHASIQAVPIPTVVETGDSGTGSVVGSMNFSFLGIARAVEGSDEEEAQSVISDSCVSVGRYHVKESYASILQSIFDKYGDIAANCHLESMSMRSYYLECVCFVVKELQSTSLVQLTKSRVKELLAILKDVESSQINVSWLRGMLNKISEDIEVLSQHRAIEAAKANSDRDLESTRKELDSQTKDLALKEEEAAIAKAKVSETRARLSELELKSSQLNETILSIRSKAEEFHGKSFLDELL